MFRQIKISFLLVGHTHEDIDQMFSCISRRLSKQNARTLLELIREIGMSYSPAIEADTLTFMFDVRKWLDECIVSNLSGHVHQHQFKLVRGPDGKALLFYKKWSTSKTWAPTGGLQLLTKLPKGAPMDITPAVEKMNLKKMEQDLPKYQLNFDEDTTRWWKAFIQNEGPVGQPKWILPCLNALPPPEPEASNFIGGINDSLLALVEKEEQQVEVLTFSYAASY